MRKLILFGIMFALLALPVATVNAKPLPGMPPGIEKAIADQVRS